MRLVLLILCCIERGITLDLSAAQININFKRNGVGGICVKLNFEIVLLIISFFFDKLKLNILKNSKMQNAILQ